MTRLLGGGGKLAGRRGSRVDTAKVLEHLEGVTC